MRIITITWLLSLCYITVVSAQGKSESSKGLKDYYRSYFPIGVAVTPALLRDSGQRSLILLNFNSLTAENAMKMESLHPEMNHYSWRDADEIVEFAQRHKLKLRGHTLCWHNQSPRWIFYDEHGKLVTKDVLLERLREHIQTVVGRYKGKIYAWDVVNEAISDNPSEYLRNSLWYQICGEDFIAKAFEYAHEADPKAVLFYNDYNTEEPAKRAKIVKLLKRLVSAGVPVQAMGLQGHWDIMQPTEDLLSSAISEYANLGLKIQITELDISVYPNGDTGKRGFTAELENRQAGQYGNLFKTFRKFNKYITGVTFWNLSDRSSWLDNFPVRGRKNYPLLFDEALNPKKAYWNVVTF